MSDSSADRDEFAQLAEEFVESWRRGNRPTVEDFAQSHPKHAERIRRLFPAMLLAENMGVPSGSGTRADSGPLPEMLGEYRIIREIGRGGMGVVYEAVQEPLGRQVALKVLASAGLADPRFRERFQREAKAAGRLHHTNIIPVFGVGEHEGVLFYAMQFIAGHGLDQLLREVVRARGRALTRQGMDDTPMSFNGKDSAKETAQSEPQSSSSSLLTGSQFEYHRGVARIGLQVATALDYAHSQGVLHRDIKPSNLMLDAAGTVWIADFGLAKTQDEDGLTHTGDFVGTMRYMAPERFRGESGPASDVYSLGVTLYEMLTFRPAFDDTDRAKLLDQVLRREPLPPRSLDRRVPRDLETIVLKAMAKEPAHRYASAQALADDLHQFLADRPITARRTRLTERVWRWCRRNPIPAGLLATVAALALVILVGSPIMSYRLWEQKQVALDKLWIANVAQAKAQRLTQEAGRRTLALQSLEAARLLNPSLPKDPRRILELRNEFFSCLALPDLGPGVAWLGAPAGTVAITFDADFRRYARGDEQGSISIRDASNDTELRRIPAEGIGAAGLKFSPNGKFLAAGYHHRYQTNSVRFRVWNTETGERVVTIDGQTGCGEADFSPDSRFVAFGRDNDQLVIHDLQDKSDGAKSYKVATLPTAIAFHPDGQRVAVACRKTIEVRNVADGKVLSTRTSERDVWALAWHPKDNVLAAASSAAILLFVDENPQPMATLRGHEMVIYGLAFHPSGELLASKSHDGTIRCWDVAARQPIIRASSVYAGCVPLQFSADGSRLAFASDGERIWTFEVARGHECRRLVVPRSAGNLLPTSADFTADSRHIAVTHLDGIRIWDCETGQILTFTPIRAGRPIRYSPDDGSLFTGNQTTVNHWRIQNESGTPRLGPPTSLSTAADVANLVVGHDGSTILIRHRDQAPRVVKLGSDSPAVTLGEHPRVRFMSLSADCKLVATGNEFGKNVRIWDASTGQMIHEIPIAGSAAVEFSPDGRWLVVATENRFVFFEPNTWQMKREIAKGPESTAGEMSFSDDGKILVVRYSPSQLRLLNPDDGSELATLQTPGHQILTWHRISRDGKRIAAAGSGNTVYLWNLAAIRRELAARQLDW